MKPICADTIHIDDAGRPQYLISLLQEAASHKNPRTSLQNKAAKGSPLEASIRTNDRPNEGRDENMEIVDALCE
jgi:hypothetical protein